MFKKYTTVLRLCDCIRLLSDIQSMFTNSVALKICTVSSNFISITDIICIAFDTADNFIAGEIESGEMMVIPEIKNYGTRIS